MNLSSIIPSSRQHQRDAVLKTAAQGARDFDKQTAKLRTDLEDGRARAAHLRASADEAGMACIRMEAELRQMTLAYDRLREGVERQLQELADPKIVAFLDELQVMQDGLRHKLERRSAMTPVDPSTGQRRAYELSNLEAIRVVSDAIGEARAKAEALKFEPYTDLEKRLAELRRSIPTVDQAEDGLEAAS